MVNEARLEELDSGLAPVTDGWFVVNVRDAAWETNDHFGTMCAFEGESAPFADLGINLRVLPSAAPKTEERTLRRVPLGPGTGVNSSTAATSCCRAVGEPWGQNIPAACQDETLAFLAARRAVMEPAGTGTGPSATDDVGRFLPPSYANMCSWEQKARYTATSSARSTGGNSSRPRLRRSSAGSASRTRSR